MWHVNHWQKDWQNDKKYWLSILFQISKQVFVSTVENNLYKLYIGEKCIKRGFQFHKKYLQNNAVQEKSGKKNPEKHIFFDKTGYRTTLGVPILINYSIFFNVRISQIETAYFGIWRHQNFDSVRDLWDLQGPHWVQKRGSPRGKIRKNCLHVPIDLLLIFHRKLACYSKCLGSPNLYVNSYWPIPSTGVENYELDINLTCVEKLNVLT